MEQSLSNNKSPIISPSPNLTGQPQVDLRKKDFDAVVFQKGYDVYLDRSVRCPCVTQATGEALVSCRNCGGTGRIYINRYETRMVLQGMNIDTKFRDWTMEKLGMVKITCLSTDHLSYNDRVTVKNSLAYAQEILYPREINGSYQARTIYNCLEVQEIFAFLSIDSPLLKLEVDTHYTIDGDTLVFDPTLADRDNFTVTIRYKHNPQFLVIDLTRDIIDSPETSLLTEQGNFPIAAVGRRAHYVTDKQNVAGNYLIDNSYEEAGVCN